MPSIRVWVDADEVLEDIETEDLCAELILRTGWQQALDKAINGSAPTFDETNYTSMRDICEAYKYGKPYEHLLRDLANNLFGFVI